MAKNTQLHRAKRDKQDEFYTKIYDISQELKHYWDSLRGKVIFLNADDPEESHFWKYFYLNFDFLDIKKVIATHYDPEKPTYKLELIRDSEGRMQTIKTPLKQNGDFRSPECIELLKEADLVVTNPPFSLFREYVQQLVDYGKEFLIMGNLNAITYKEIFKLIMANKIWLGYTRGALEFRVPEDYPGKISRIEDGVRYIKMGNVRWYTNLPVKYRREELLLWRTYKGNEEQYPKYDNYDAINVDKVRHIPMDYEGAMGVPITIMDHFNPDQFEIIGIDRYLLEELTGRVSRFFIEGKEKYARIIIKNRHPRKPMTYEEYIQKQREEENAD